MNNKNVRELSDIQPNGHMHIAMAKTFSKPIFCLWPNFAELCVDGLPRVESCAQMQMQCTEPGLGWGTGWRGL